MCDQQRLRPACASAQSDQSLWMSLEYSISVNLLIKHHLEFLTLQGGCTGSSESILVKIPHCWKSHVEAHICTFRLKIRLLCALYIYTKNIKISCELAWYNTIFTWCGRQDLSNEYMASRPTTTMTWAQLTSINKFN